MKTLSYSLMALALLVGGCDFLDSSKSRKEEMRLEMEKADREAAEKAAATAAMKAYVEGKCKLVEEARKSVADKVEALSADATKLEKAVAAIMAGDEADKLSYEVRLLRVLKDDTVNEIAQKYMATGFSAQREAFVARVREARAHADEYKDAVRKSEAAFDEKLETSKEWSSQSESQRQAEIKRLRKEIAALEKKWQGVRRGLKGTASNDRERNQIAKEYDYEGEINIKRRQLDYLTNPDTKLQQQNRALERQQDAHWRARSTKSLELYDIDRRLKPKVTELDVAKEVEAATLGKLREEIKGQRSKLAVKLEKLDKQTALAKGMMLEIPVCKGGELERLRFKADRQLSLED